MNRSKYRILVVINSLLLLLTFISMINIMSINWNPFATLKLYLDYEEILKLSFEELNMFFNNQFRYDIVFSFVPNLILFYTSISIFILVNTKSRINRSIKNNPYRNFNLIISHTMNRILILMIPLSILFNYLFFLPRFYGYSHYYNQIPPPFLNPELIKRILLLNNILSKVIVLNQIVFWTSTGTFLLMKIFSRNIARNTIRRDLEMPKNHYQI